MSTSSLLAGIPLWFGFCSLDSKAKGARADFSGMDGITSVRPEPIILCIHKHALPEHKAVEQVLIDRAKGALMNITNGLSEADVDEVEFADCILYLEMSSATATCLS